MKRAEGIEVENITLKIVIFVYFFYVTFLALENVKIREKDDRI